MVRGVFLNISPFTKFPFLQKLREVCLDCYLSSTMFLHSLIFLVSCCRFKDYQELFPPQPLEKEAEIPIPSPKKPSKTAVYLQESQVSGEDSKDKTGDQETTPRHCRPRRRVALLAYLFTKAATLWDRFSNPHLQRKNLRLRAIVTQREFQETPVFTICD